MLRNPISTLRIFALVMLLGYQPAAFGQAYCALRDPIESINMLFPQATSHRSIVKVIDEDIRQEVSRRLPPNSLHFSEIGRHTLYVAFADDKPLGFVHLRSEESDWGLVEVAWALDTNLRILDFRFQRCRSRLRNVVENETFRAQLRGLSFKELATLLQADGVSLNTARITVPADAQPLAEVVLICALKTLLVTELGWADEVQHYRAWQTAASAFDTVGDVETLVKPLNSKVRTDLAEAFGDAGTGIERNSVSVARVLDADKRVLGVLYSGEVQLDQRMSRIDWVIDANRTVIGIVNRDGWPDEHTRQSFDNVIGMDLSSPEQCSNRAELITLEALITAQHSMAAPARE